MLGYQTYERLRFVRIQLIYDEDPARLRLAGDHRFKVIGKILLLARWTHRGGDDPPGGHSKTGNQSQGAVPDVLKFTQFDLAGDHRAARVLALKGLHAGFFVG